MLCATLKTSATSVSRRLAFGASFTPRRTLATIKGKPHYTARVTADGAGWNGRAFAVDDVAKPIELPMAIPTVMGGTGQGHNPEQLLALGYSTCFLGSLHHVAEAAGKADAVKDAKVHLLSHVGTPNERPGFAFAVDLQVEGVEDESLIQAAHEFCPFSRALTEGIQVNVTKA